MHEAPKSVSGNAGSADKLSSKRNITLTGAVTGGVVTDFFQEILQLILPKTIHMIFQRLLVYEVS